MLNFSGGHSKNIKVSSTVDKHELRYLLANLRKSIELWFLANRDLEGENAKLLGSIKYEASYQHIQTNVVAILKHGLHSEANLENNAASFSSSSQTGEAVIEDCLQKLIDEFEWVRQSAQLRIPLQHDIFMDRQMIDCLQLSPSAVTSVCSSVDEFLLKWTLRSLKANYLCSCLQTLVADKELLETYYFEESFLRDEKYATALFICVSALEKRQCSLLSQIAPELNSLAQAAPTIARHKRSNSHPTFSISPTKNTAVKLFGKVDGQKEKLLSSTSNDVTHKPTVFSTFRKIKSLPVLANVTKDEPITSPLTRPRSKTVTEKSTKEKKPQSILNNTLKPKLTSDLSLAIASFSSYCCGDETQPSTSASSKISTLASFASNSSNTTKTSETSTSTSRKIELIKCDDIKIWTDQNWEHHQQEHQSTPKQTTESFSIPNSVKQAKSISPINSFLSSLFSTPPASSGTSWYSQQEPPYKQHTEAIDAKVSSFPCNSCHNINVSSASSVFDSFLPQYGKKLRSRNSQNLFEDGISSLDQKYYNCTQNAVAATSKSDKAEPGDYSSNSEPTKRTRKSCQSLTAFLQMAQLSRNNTELEKENAHFRISEAIISAIEHIKWAKIEPDKLRRQNETTTAMDWLESEQNKKNPLNKETQEGLNEHISYAELGESCLDLLSAEVVGLCIISKFNDRHLPKVSELKWLVAEEDTPQNLLPMPDNSTSANPDDNILPSVTRGTKYWAPPRQQIIFTDHPPPNRKELIRKQNNRCAGCGMRVSLQYLSSFRYCTYLGKYHCTGCHRNQITATPAKILNFWEFKCYPVSVFAYRLLDQMYTFPLFYVPDLNPVLYTRSKQLLAARTKRVELSYVKDFIKTCRFATIEQQYFESIPDYICADPDTWSLSDFVDTNNNSMQLYITEMIIKCEKHIFNCVLCSSRGFICEHCHCDEVLFPWQNKVFRCDRCGTCFHRKCWKSLLNNCCRCQRIKNRQEVNEIMLKNY